MADTLNVWLRGAPVVQLGESSSQFATWLRGAPILQATEPDAPTAGDYDVAVTFDAGTLVGQVAGLLATASVALPAGTPFAQSGQLLSNDSVTFGAEMDFVTTGAFPPPSSTHRSNLLSI